MKRIATPDEYRQLVITMGLLSYLKDAPETAQKYHQMSHCWNNMQIIAGGKNE